MHFYALFHSLRDRAFLVLDRVPFSLYLQSQQTLNSFLAQFEIAIDIFRLVALKGFSDT